MILLYLYFIGLYIRPQDWWPPTLGFPVDTVIFGLLLLFGFLKGRKSQGLPSAPQNRQFALWILAIVLSCLTSGDFQQALLQGENYIKWFIIYLSVLLFVDSFEKLRNLIIFVCLLTIVLAVEGVDHKLSPDGIGWAGQQLGWTDAETRRAGGTGRIQWVGLWDGPNVFCLLYVVAVPFLLQFAMAPWHPRLRMVAGLSLPLLFVAIYFTNSRGGFLTLVAGVFLTFWRKFKGTKKIVVTGAILLPILAYAPSRMSSMDDEDRSTYHRIEVWYYAVDMLKQDPVFGIGSGTFQRYTGSLIAHNSFIQNMGETGLFGLSLWVLLLYTTVQMLRRIVATEADAHRRSMASGLLISLYAYFVASLTLTTEFELLYILIAFSVALAGITGVKMQLNKGDYIKVAGIVGTGIVSVFVFTRAYLG